MKLERTRYYQNHAERLLRRHGVDFARFTAGYEQLVTLGEERLRAFETTGYNILHSANDMPMASRRRLLFYGNYIARTRHFGLLLATMEEEGIITPSQVRFGVRAATVLYKFAWGEVSPDLAQTGIVQRINPQEEVSEHGVMRSVETVITFSSNNSGQARAIAGFLKERAKCGQPGAIEESNFDPDIRATASLRGVLPESDFPTVSANIRSLGKAQVIALRHRASFGKPWQTIALEANTELAGYLAEEGVSP